MSNSKLLKIFAIFCFTSASPWLCRAESIARVWDEQILSAIRIDIPHPPVQARNLFHFSIAMYDAWAAYDPVAIGYLFREKHTASDVAAARREAISYAAYRILRERYALSRSPEIILPALDAHMAGLGYDKDNLSFDTSTPAGVGNTVAAMVSEYFAEDGARQAEGYSDFHPSQGGYVPLNLPLFTNLSGTTIVNVNRWQRLFVADAVDQSGHPIEPLQKFVGAQWLGVRPFALIRQDPAKPWIDPGPQPKLGGVGDAQFRSEVVEIIRRSSELTPDDGEMIDISPGAFGNNRLGANDGSGHALNPFTGQAYAPNWVKRGDFSRVLAEFWADGPTSETPPGHWNSIANAVSDDPNLEKRIGGVGPLVDDLEWDVKMYFSLNAALHDAACAAWSVKRYYDGGRPLSAIRYMGGLGQSSQPNAPFYHPNGLPLVSGLVEQVTSETSQPGQRHEGLPINSIAVLSWPGQPGDAATQYSGVRWIRAVDWLPYQRSNFVTPAFPGYVSGHSTFSRSAAEVLAAITGSAFFPGGMGTFTAPANSFLFFERGPSQSVQLQWGTYYDAADQAGLSRLWGGIHFSADDLIGRSVGAQCGKQVWEFARRHFGGSVAGIKGKPVSGQPEGVVYGSLGTPQPGAYRGAVLAKKVRTAAVFATDGTVMLKVGDSIPEIPGSVIQKLGFPSGDAVLATLKVGKGGVTAQNSVVLLTGLSTGTPHVAVRARVTPTNYSEITIKRFAAVDGNGTDVFFLAALHGPGISPVNNLALCAVLPNGEVNVLARKGGTADGRVISTLGTLVGSKGTLAEGRWRVDDHTLGVRLGFKDGAKGLYSIGSTSWMPEAWTLLARSDRPFLEPLAGAQPAKFGLPAFGPQGWAAVTNLTVGLGGIVKSTSNVLINDLGDGSPHVLARLGGEVPDSVGEALPDIAFKKFRDPVLGSDGRIAVAANLVGSGITARNSTGIWYASDGKVLKLLARAGDPAVGGGRWAAFSSLVLPNDSRGRPIFVATLAPKKSDGITNRNNRGLWAMDSRGGLMMLLRTGEFLPIDGVFRRIKTFTALTPVPGSIGAASGHNEQGRVSVLVTFTDGLQATLQLGVP